MIEALTQQIGQLPAHLARSLTWDQGKELAAHRKFLIDTDIEVLLLRSHSPWQRGSNENTNGLLRQYPPRNQIAAELNGRPRQTLDWMTPTEKMDQLLR
jgi:transposase, IS30 family